MAEAALKEPLSVPPLLEEAVDNAYDFLFKASSAENRKIAEHAFRVFGSLDAAYSDYKNDILRRYNGIPVSGTDGEGRNSELVKLILLGKGFSLGYLHSLSVQSEVLKRQAAESVLHECMKADGSKVYSPDAIDNYGNHLGRTGNLDRLNEIYAKFKNNAEDCLA